MSSDLTPSLKAAEAELATYLGALAIFANECITEEAGYRMLELPPQGVSGRIADHIDVKRTIIGRMLPVWFNYAHRGVLNAGYQAHWFGANDEPLERLEDLLHLLKADDPYFEFCLEAAAGTEEPLGHLEALAVRARARVSLDEGESLSLTDIAALAGMNERSVRNATTATGEGKLSLNDTGYVTNEEARRWLDGRRNFTATQRRSLPRDLSKLPDFLEAVEIPHFVATRIQALSATWGELGKYEVNPLLVEAGRRAGLSRERMEAVTQLPLDIRPSECQGLARLLEVDVVWFTHQVMAALFPDQVDMLLNPGNWQAPDHAVAVAVADADESMSVFTVELTESMLKHGYIDFPMAMKPMFPDDCFGGREEGNEGAQVELVFGGHRVMTDVRVKSAKTISPRKRFTAWLNRELGARPADRIRVKRTADRCYTLEHIPG